MDPNKAYAEMTEAYAEQRWDDAIEYAENLLGWLRKGGFAPTGQDSTGCAAKCREILAAARKNAG